MRAALKVGEVSSLLLLIDLVQYTIFYRGSEALGQNRNYFLTFFCPLIPKNTWIQRKHYQKEKLNGKPRFHVKILIYCIHRRRGGKKQGCEKTGSEGRC